jgi:predicted ATPase/class 3 adenylate cyclase
MVDLPDGPLPSGVVTFLFTDVEGSTRAWEASPESMAQALVQHDEAIMSAISEHGGLPVKARGEGDSWFVVFASAVNALAGAVEVQRRLAEVEWATSPGLAVRASLHTGAADLRSDDYYGPVVNRAARLRSIAHGGQTILSGATYELVRDQVPVGVSLIDMGDHRLKDLTRPEHVYQVDADGLRSDFPALLSLDAIPNNLPVQLTEFVGREQELEHVKQVIGDSRLLTILAPGGSGKTRLAIQAAAALSGGFDDGVFFVGLAPISSASEIVRTVAESLGIALSSDQDPQSQLLAYLTNKQQLLVFDNFEHVVAGADIVTDILKNAPDVRVIATSRSKLNLSGEAVMTLHGLESSWDSTEHAYDTSGVQLFVHAAKRADTSFALTDEDLTAIGAILDHVGGMPLGIELAASWVSALPIAEIADEIARSLDFLETEAGNVPDRHRSIRAVFDYSWAMLSEDDRRTFSALSVFRGGFTREAAEEVAGSSLRGLASLVSRSLLVHDRKLGRYGVHELLRQYAADALLMDAGRCDEVHDAHAQFYSNVTARAEELISVCDQEQALHIVEAELDNIRAAWRHSVAVADGAAVRKFVAGLWLLHEIRGWHSSAVGLFGEAADTLDATAEDEGARIGRFLASAAQAWFLALLGQPNAAADRAGEAVSALASLSDPVAHAMAIQFWCPALLYLTRLDEVRAATMEGSRIATSLRDEYLRSEIDGWLAFAELYLGNNEAAAHLFDEIDAVLTRRGDNRALPWNDIGRSMLAARTGRYDKAIRILEVTVQRAHEIGYRRAVQVASQQLGDVLLEGGDLEAAESAYLEALAMSEEMGSVAEMAEMLVRIARVRAKSGRLDDAGTILESVLAHPVSDQSTLSTTVSIREMATELRADLGVDAEAQVDLPTGMSASVKNLGVMAKELLAGTWTAREGEASPIGGTQ